MQKTRVTVHVAGQTLHLCGTEDETYIKSVAAYVDEKIEKAQQTHPSLGTSTCILLGALNMADELFKLRQQYTELDYRIEELRRLSMPVSQTTRDAVPVKHPFEDRQTITKT
ncbi:MAG TPA: cell division protein ZapA [Clostridia bacterium]|nr:cell division protein ZapA [Clostridia bacterium]HPY37241.1 cell division protein ZapA [Clostridia bacterium]